MRAPHRFGRARRAFAARSPGRRLAALAVVVLSTAAAASAQFPWFSPEREPTLERADPEFERLPYDGRFTFIRLRYDQDAFGGGWRRFWREPPWAHDYPRAERNLLKILDELTFIVPLHGAYGGNVLTFDDPALLNYPVAYLSEPGFWEATEAEARNLGDYLRKGGFLIVDDFRGADLQNLELQMRRVIPEGRFVELDASHPIFHAFFDIDSLEFVQFYGREERAAFYGMYEDNDPAKRLMVIANHNNDIGEYWEFSDTGFVPIELSNEAYKLGVNYIVYGLTH